MVDLIHTVALVFLWLICLAQQVRIKTLDERLTRVERRKP